MTILPVTVEALVSQLPGVLLAHVPAYPPATTVDGVHISELVDPTPYLHGGELLLTTGMALPLSGQGARAYVARLRRRGVVGLGLGLGPVYDAVPAVLERACARQELPLLVIPAEAPFQNVTRAFWSLQGEAQERVLSAALDSHRRLVAAATSADPVPAVLEVVGRAIGGDAVLTDPRGEVTAGWPPPASPTPELTAAVHRIRALGPRSAATFPVGERIGSLNPIVAGEEVTGYLCTVSAQPLESTNRGLLLAALAMLGLDAHHRQRSTTGDLLLRTAVAALVDRGHLPAVRTLAAALPVEAPPARVRVAVVRRGHGPGDRVRAALEDALPAHGWWAVAGERATWLMSHPGQVDLGETVLREVVESVGPGAAATSGPVVDLAEVHRMRTRLEAETMGLPGGTVRCGLVGATMPFVSEDWARAVLQPLQGRAPLLEAVAALLRHRGSWEPAARELGIHRNSLRARIQQAERLLGGELADPDLSSRVWIALRSTGLDSVHGG